MNKTLLTRAAASLCVLGAVSASAGVFAPASPGQQPGSHTRLLANDFTPKAVDKDGNMVPDETHVVPYFMTNNTVGVVSSPTGEDWFYTLELDGRKITENPYFTDWDFETFHVKVYDKYLNPIGQAAGRMIRPEGAEKCQGVEVGTQITRSFFNTNTSDYEITLTLNFNPGKDEQGNERYGAKQTTEAYSLTAEVPEGGSKCVFQQPGVINSAINSGNSVSENYVMALFEDTSWDGEDKDTGYFNVFKKAGWGTPAEKVISFEVDKTKASSDGYNESLPFVMTTRGNDVYVAQALYEKPFLDDPTAENPTLSKDNNYVITLYKSASGSYEKVAETKIPCVAPEGSDYIYRSYALGNFSGAADITFEFGDGSTPCYIISVVDSGTTDETSAYYAVYDINGNEVARFGNGSDGYVEFTDIPGKPKQYGFDMYDDYGDYCTVLVDYPSLEQAGRLPKLFEYEDDIWAVTSVPDRTLYDGGVYYVASAMPSGETQGDAVGNHVVWFTADGDIHHLDHLDLGDNVAKVLFNLQGSVFNPYMFNTNKDFEYLAWIYRWNENGVGTSLELSVCDSKGRIMAKRDFPANSAGNFCYVANTATDPVIMISYRTVIPGTYNWEQNNEFIKLPLNDFEGEGTVESPYIIKTFGDLNQMRNNLTSNFRLANSIDCDGLQFRPVEGEFLGTLDGNGFEIKNLSITSDAYNAAFFTALGHKANWDETPETAVVRDITFSDPALAYTGPTTGVKEFAIVAHEANNAMMSNVSVINPTFEVSGVKARFGVLAANTDKFTAEACGVKGADINVPLSTALGGLVANARESKFNACSFDGKLAGRDNVGGLFGTLQVEPSYVTDCHVNATIEGNSNVGGAVGSMNRSSLLRVLVEGSLHASGSNIGGVAGYLEAAEGAESASYLAIDKCVVALSEFSLPEEAEATHRIVGYTSIDKGDTYEYVPDPNDPDTYIPVTIPATPEARLGSNFVVTSIAPVETGDLATEGTTVPADDVDNIWFEEQGYGFGMSVEAPWAVDYMSGSMIPSLYFERNMAVSVIFTPDEITGNEGETIKAHLFFGGFDITDGNFTTSSSNPEVADFGFNSELGADNEVIFDIDLKKEGTAELIFTYGNDAKAVLYVTVKKAAGIGSATVAKTLAYKGGVIYAEGCGITVYDTQGRIIAQGTDTLSTEGFGTGIYIVKATAGDGTASTLKISVR